MSDAAFNMVGPGSRIDDGSSPRRRTAFRTIARIMAISAVSFGLFTAVFAVATESQEIHAVHNTVVASLLLVLSAPAVIAAARDPDRPGRPMMHLTTLGIAAVGTMIAGRTFDPFTAPFVALSVALWVLRRRGDPLMPAGRASPVLLTLVFALAVPIVSYALDQAELQRIDRTSEHASLFHWVETSFYAVAIALVALLAALRPRAFGMSASSAVIASSVLGIASLALPGHASALDVGWAWAVLGWSLAFAVAYGAERRRLSRRSVTA